MPTYNLGTATASSRAAQLLKASYEREQRETLTAAQILVLVRKDIRRVLAQRAVSERLQQRDETNETEDITVDNEVTVA